MMNDLPESALSSLPGRWALSYEEPPQSQLRQVLDPLETESDYTSTLLQNLGNMHCQEPGEYIQKRILRMLYLEG